MYKTDRGCEGVEVEVDLRLQLCLRELERVREELPEGFVNIIRLL